MSFPAIEISQLHKTYKGGKVALNGIDLNIPQGTIFGLLGPNGAGKSTLINILAGLVRKSSGQVTIWGFNQDDSPRQSRATIGVMPQELNMDPFFTPRAVLDMQAGLFGVPKSQRRTAEILDMVGLTDQAEAYARTLSGGMKRRLLLGKALVHQPQILVLDEPTAGVDIELRQMLWAHVRQLNKEGMTIILTTHYLEEAQEMCDDIAIIDQGQVRVRDTTQNLLSRLDQKTLILRTDAPVPSDIFPANVTIAQRDGTVSLTYSQSNTRADQIIDAVRTVGIGITDIRSQDADLEDVFLSLTQKG
ncbi:MAG: ABC transporter ATP-binding protein [Pseudomonadota bacterium]